eukprot:43915-Pleurochrysis_carterae.AAC.2
MEANSAAILRQGSPPVARPEGRFTRNDERPHPKHSRPEAGETHDWARPVLSDVRGLLRLLACHTRARTADETQARTADETQARAADETCTPSAMQAHRTLKWNASLSTKD